MPISSLFAASAQQEIENQVVDKGEYQFAAALVWSNRSDPLTKLLVLALLQDHEDGTSSTRLSLSRMTGLRLSEVDKHLVGAMKLFGSVLGR